MVASGTRKARAISAVVSPPSVRNVRAMRASGASVGWQQVKIRRNWSSAMALSGMGSDLDVGSASRRARASAARCLPGRLTSRRSRSLALLRAAVMIQAAGLSGVPVRGQRSRAATNASCTASSARSKSPRRRMSDAVIGPELSRKTRVTSSLRSFPAP